MKKYLFIMSAIAVSAAALTSCNKEQEIISNEEGIPFEVIAGAVDTKTANDDMATLWLATDHINLFHAVHDDDTYNNDGDFSAKSAGASVAFTGTLKAGTEPTSGNTYDWFAVYPYKSGYTTPDGTKYITIPSTQTQSAGSNKAHLAGDNCPLGGNVKNVAYDAQPSIAMKQLTSIVKIVVTNKTAAAVGVSSISFTAPSKIVGSFNLNLTGDSPVLSGSSGSNTATLNVTTPGSLAYNASSEYYIAIKPFTASAGSTFTIVVTTNNGPQSVTSAALEEDFTFEAGKIHQITFNYTKSLADPLSTETDPILVGFETGEDFNHSSTFNNQTVAYDGAAGHQWGVLSGHASTSGAISGSMSLSLRWYYSNSSTVPSAFTDFRMTSVRYISFKAKVVENSGKKAGVKVYYSTDNRLTWTLAATKTLTTSTASYDIDLGEVKSNVAFKFEEDLPASLPGSGNLQLFLDDISFSKTAAVPGIAMTTSAASNVITVAGTTATLNGVLTLVNGAVIGSLSEAGFYYKASGAGSFTKVECDPAPAAEGAYTYNLTGLTAGTEYTYHAYGIYDGGDVVVGSDLTFTPIAATVYTMTIDGNAVSGTKNVHWTTADTTLDYGTVDTNPVSWTTAVTWNSQSYMGGTTSQVQIGKGDSKSVRYSPSTITISSDDFAGKKILSASLTGFYQTNATTNLTITAGTTNILTNEALVKGTSTKYTSTGSPVTLSTGQNVVFTLNTSDQSGSVVIQEIEVVYVNP